MVRSHRPFADRFGSRYMLAFCRSEYATISLWRGDWREAGMLLEAAVEDFRLSRPAMSGGTLALLAELRRRQGCVDEAEALLQRAGSDSAAQLVRARLALDSSDALRAAELAERCLRNLPAHRRLQRTPALQVLARARIRQGAHEAAGEAVTALAEVTRIVDTTPLRAALTLLEGMRLAAMGVFDQARPPLEDAVDGFERSGAPYESAEARLELAEVLSALGRRAAAEVEIRAALGRLKPLGAVVAERRARAMLVTSDVSHGKHGRHALTPRETEVLRLLAEGLTNRAIAERLEVSTHTVHRHVTNILRKLDLSSRSAAAAYAVRQGL
ncbi:LuxR C-terminal-related transcriptional regulator [Arhodomonas sp. AD133]|uniref:LuxR C-terminal-related transcriptional regulator n=1 Tax=Arhodomonas sp. AD133 TaxID=3415009 RepID=UPI003EBE6477